MLINDKIVNQGLTYYNISSETFLEGTDALLFCVLNGATIVFF